jgi:hypothetical protein
MDLSSIVVVVLLADGSNYVPWHECISLGASGSVAIAGALDADPVTELDLDTDPRYSARAHRGSGKDGGERRQGRHGEKR